MSAWTLGLDRSFRKDLQVRVNDITNINYTLWMHVFDEVPTSCSGTGAVFLWIVEQTQQRAETRRDESVDIANWPAGDIR